MTENLCLVPRIESIGGPASFQQSFLRAAAEFGVEAHFELDRKDVGAYLVIGGPLRPLPALIRARRQGVPVVHRLNGMNWLHRVQSAGLRYGIKADLANSRIAWTRRFLASAIVYQSRFCEENWNAVHGPVSKPSTIIYNGVDTDRFSPIRDPENWRTSEPIRVLIAEGNLQHGSEILLGSALDCCAALRQKYGVPVRLTIAGNVPDAIRARTEAKAPRLESGLTFDWKGVIPKDELIALEREATFFLSVEPEPACPNAVIEALSVGLPVVGYDTGSLKDVVGPGGAIADPGVSLRKLEPPDSASLAAAAGAVLENRAAFSAAARETALRRFRVEKMTEAYLKICLE